MRWIDIVVVQCGSGTGIGRSHIWVESCYDRWEVKVSTSRGRSEIRCIDRDDESVRHNSTESTFNDGA